MSDQLSRLENLIGTENLNILKNSRVAVFGIGGVGGYAVEALARSGVGTIDIIDSDKVDVTNLNRQIIALHSTVGQQKVDVAEKRIKGEIVIVVSAELQVTIIGEKVSCPVMVRNVSAADTMIKKNTI